MINMNKKIFVNGALLDETFLKENILEAQGLKWNKKNGSQLPAEHLHCLICTISITKEYDHYQSGNLVICEHCFSNYLDSKSDDL